MNIPSRLRQAGLDPVKLADKCEKVCPVFSADEWDKYLGSILVLWAMVVGDYEERCPQPPAEGLLNAFDDASDALLAEALLALPAAVVGWKDAAQAQFLLVAASVLIGEVFTALAAGACMSGEASRQAAEEAATHPRAYRD
jgi:hypothetical protein